MDQEAAACRAAVLRYQNRQTAERDSIQTMADAIATLAAPTVAAPIDSQGGLSDFDQQAQSQAVAGDNSGSNLAVSDDVQALAQGNALSDATPPDLSKYDPQVSDIDALAQAAAAKNVQLAANDPTLPQPPPPQSALSQKVDEIEGAIADARDSTIHDMKQGTLNFVNWVSNGFSSEPSPVSSNSDAPSLWQRLNDYSPPPANSTVDTAFKYGGDVITNDRVNNNAVAQQVEKRSLFQINGIFDRASQTMDQTSQALNGDGPPPDPIGPVVFDLRDMAPDLMQKLNAWDAFSVKVQSKWSDFKNWLKDDQSDKLFQTNP
jgi:hypothetical protein